MILKKRARRTEMFVGILLALALLLLYVLFSHGFTANSFRNSIFAIVFTVVSPFLAITTAGWVLVIVLLFGICAFLQLLFVKSLYLRFGIAAETLVWMYFGLWCNSHFYY